ncbi:MAG: O-antigen ligase family protein [Ferruginibacter sp.]
MRLGFILAALGMLLFFASILFIGNKRSTYLLFIAFFFPFVDLWITPSSFGNLSVFDGVSLVAALLFFRDLVSLNKGNRFYVVTALIFLVLITISTLASEFKVWSLFHLPPVITPFIYAALLLREIKDDEGFLFKLIGALKIAAWVGVFFIVMQIVTRMGFTHYDGLNQNVIDGDGFRYPGFFMDAQVNGAYMAMISVLFLVNFYDPSNPRFKNYWQFAVMVIGVVLAGSRSPLLGLGAGIVFLTIFVGGNFRPVFLTILIICGVTGLLFADNIPVFKRFGELNDSLSFRASLWADAWKIFYKEYMLGIGTESYQQYVMRYSQDQFLLMDNDEIVYLLQPENGYLKWLVEFGLFGTILLFLMILAPPVKVLINFFKGKKIITQFFFITPLIIWLISFSSLYNLYDRRLVVLVVTYLVILAAYPTDFVFESEEQQ